MKAVGARPLTFHRQAGPADSGSELFSECPVRDAWKSPVLAGAVPSEQPLLDRGCCQQCHALCHKSKVCCCWPSSVLEHHSTSIADTETAYRTRPHCIPWMYLLERRTASASSTMLIACPNAVVDQVFHAGIHGQEPEIRCLFALQGHPAFQATAGGEFWPAES